jgi:hypothetical protein
MDSLVHDVQTMLILYALLKTWVAHMIFTIPGMVRMFGSVRVVKNHGGQIVEKD